jgi:phosphatidate cytidylyltransferase
LVGLIIVPLIHPWTFTSGLTLGIVVAIVAPLGDLAESLLKRNLGIKDMGRLLPGHGGMLDRVDGLLFVLPATYYLVRAFHLG